MSKAYLPAIAVFASRVAKRSFDIVASVGLLVLASPVMAAVALAILIDDGGPVLFRQTRIGRHGRHFTILKFRTMKKATPNRASGGFADVHQYITASGRFLRKASLDELPQLFNIIAGQMSIIGPRPLIPEEEYIHRLRAARGVYRMRPGITGLAQINGRDLVDDQQKAHLDAVYVQGFSIWADVRILWRTVIVVAQSKGVQEGAPRELVPR